jgi:hypothetical protein
MFSWRPDSDEFIGVIFMVRGRQVNEHFEAEITTRLFKKSERFIDLFGMDAKPYGLK